MSEMKGCEEFSKYDSMPTEDLQEILCKHAHDQLRIQMDTEELFYIMEVLSDRENNDPNRVHQTAGEAYATFRKYYMPKVTDDAVPAKTVKFPRHGKAATRWLKAAVATAAVLVLVLGVSISAEAFNIDIWGKFASWTQEIFRFADANNPTVGTMPVKENNLELKSLQETLDKHMITEKIAPTWLPEGYVNRDLSVMDSPRERSIHAIYINNDTDNDTELIISIRQTIGIEPEQIEKSEDLVEEYDSNGIRYYIFNNYDVLRAAWVVGEFECYISGKITMEEMKLIIDSIE